MSSTSDTLVDRYLHRLDAELRDLPRARRREVVDEIAAHIEDARSEGSLESEAGLRTLLDRIGDPAEIAAEARARFGVRRGKASWREIGALVLLPFGGLVLPVVGWFVGVVLLWTSDSWTTRDKLIGTLVVPGGLLVSAGLAVTYSVSGSSCSHTIDPATHAAVGACSGGGTSVREILGAAVLIALVLAPLATCVYLARRMRPVATAAI